MAFRSSFAVTSVQVEDKFKVEDDQLDILTAITRGKDFTYVEA